VTDVTDSRGRRVAAETERDVVAFLYHEAELLDDRRFDEWLELLDDELRYLMPVRATRPEGQQPEFSDVMHHFDDTKRTLAMRVDRLKSGDAWAEVPPSRTRHFLTNIRIQERSDELVEARSNLLLMRTRGDEALYQSLTAERVDVLRRGGASGWTLLERTILLDATTLPTYNLAFFL
jgi:ethylbenzene dioxygenase beta subunit